MTGQVAPTAWSILAPPGWRRMRADELRQGDPLGDFVRAAREAGRADLVLQARSLVAELRSQASASALVELYLPATAEAAELAPASLTLSRYRTEEGVQPRAAAERMAKARPVEEVDDAGALQFRFRAESSRGADQGVHGSHLLSVLPRPGSADGLLATFTALHDGSGADALLALGEVMLSSFTWRS